MTTSIGMSAATRLPETPKKPWTVLFYGSADNLLSPYQLQNLKDMEAVGSTDQVNIVTQYDAWERGATRRLMVKGDAPAGELASPVVQDLGQVNMAKPETLSEFIKWGMETYPAEHYMVVMAGFGNGWSSNLIDVGDRSVMELSDLHQAFQSAREATSTKIDVLAFDAELMGMAEVAHELRDDASYLVVSPHTEKKERWPYTPVLSTAFPQSQDGGPQAVALAPVDVAKALVTATAERPKSVPSMAAYDLSQEPHLAEGIRNLSTAIQASGISNETVRRIKTDSQHYLIESYLDLHHLCTQIINEPSSEAGLRAAAVECQQAVDDMVVAERHSKWLKHSHGVSIETQWGYPQYADLPFSKETQWNLAQERLGQGDKAPVP